MSTRPTVVDNGPAPATLAVPTPAPVRARWSFAVLAATATVFLAAASAPTPLYAVFRAQLNLSTIVITAVFAIYAVALLLALLTVGSLSDHVGRKPVIIGSIVLEIISMVVFVRATDASALYLARALQGLATGAVTTALAAGLTDLSTARAQHVNSLTPLVGMAVGAVAAAGVVSTVRAPVPVVFGGLVVILVVLLIATTTIGESATHRGPGALASLRIRLGVPPASRAALAAAAPMLVALWAIGGFAMSLGPALTGALSGVAAPSPMLGGLFVCALNAAGALSVAMFLRVDAARVLAGSAVALATGAAAILLATALDSLAVLLVGAVIAGFGFGGGFMGALRTVMPTAAPHERASLAATLYVIGYLSMAVPAIGAGVVAYRWGIGAAVLTIGSVVILLALAALLLTHLRTARLSGRGPAADSE